MMISNDFIRLPGNSRTSIESPEVYFEYAHL